LLIDDKTKTAAAVDPFDRGWLVFVAEATLEHAIPAAKVVDAAKSEGVELGEHLITTHHVGKKSLYWAASRIPAAP
jgi:hypothetical protein